MVKPAMKMKNWLLRIIIFFIFVLLGRWVAFSALEKAVAKESEFQLGVMPGMVNQRRLILIIVDQLDRNPNIVEAWWIGSRVDMPVAMVSLYPYYSQDKVRDDLLEKTFRLRGVWFNRQPQTEFFNTLKTWDIHWDSYIVIDQSIQAAIVDTLDGVMIDGSIQSGDLIIEKQRNIHNEQTKLVFQSKLWAAICSSANQHSTGLDLRKLPVKLSGHLLSSPELMDGDQLEIIPAQPIFPVCLMNTGLPDPTLPTIQPH